MTRDDAIKTTCDVLLGSEAFKEAAREKITPYSRHAEGEPS